MKAYKIHVFGTDPRDLGLMTLKSKNIPGVSSARRKRVIVLRGVDQAQEMVEELISLGLDVIHCPMIEIQPNKGPINRITRSFIASFTTLIFTSANGVNVFFHSMLEKGIDVRALANKKFFTVGPKTRDSLISFGFIPDGIPDKFVAESLLDLFHADLKKEKILIPTAAGARAILPEELRGRGARVVVLKIYRTIAPKPRPIEIRDGDLVVFTSSSTAEHFFNSLLYKNQEIISFCIGEITSKAVSKYISENIYISKESTSESLVECIRGWITGSSR